VTSSRSAGITRREALRGLGVLLARTSLASTAGALDASFAGSAAAARTTLNDRVAYGRGTLPAGVRSRFVDSNNGVTLHLLEAGFEQAGRPCLVLLHGFPELAYTWRHQLLPLAGAGFHVIAPDLRGYGRSVLKPVAFGDDLLPYSPLHRVADVLGVVRALGYTKVASVVGHDWGSPVAAWCALLRPEVFRSVVLMSTPFGGLSPLPLGTADHPRPRAPEVDIEAALAALPRPRKHYWWCYASAEANDDMWHAPQGVHDLLRAMYYFKSADWKGNRPFVLKAWTASELAQMPTYYIMDLKETIAGTMAAEMPTKAQIAACHWMPEADLDVYATQYRRTGFQGGLNPYRILTGPRYEGELQAFADRTIDVPALFIGGAEDWGVRQVPGLFEAMQQGACTHFLGAHLIAGCGHSVPEEQPAEVTRLLVGFLRTIYS
jgi:pimeloyl-ACP methyl ester carboxylesterase